MFQVVQATLEQSGNSHVVAADVTSNTDRLVAALLEGCGDAHFRVAAAALAALGVGLASPCSRAFEPQLDRVMTALFARWVSKRAGAGNTVCIPGRRMAGDMEVAGMFPGPLWSASVGRWEGTVSLILPPNAMASAGW